MTGVNVRVLGTRVGVIVGDAGIGWVSVWVVVEGNKVPGFGAGCLAQPEIMKEKIIHTKKTIINLIQRCFINILLYHNKLDSRVWEMTISQTLPVLIIVFEMN